MANTYKWKIDSIKVRPSFDGLSNMVCSCRWEATAISDDETPLVATEFDFVTFGAPLDSSEFVPFEQLTEETMLQWCWAPEDNITKINTVKKEVVEARLDAAIEKLRVPKEVEITPPWIASEE